MTSIKRLIEKLQKNWLAKVVSLFIAILLYIFYHASQIDKKNFVVPLKIEENGIVMHVGTVPNYITVVVRTNDTIMNMINSSDFEGRIDISNITEPGIYTLPVYMTLSSKLMELDPLEVILKDEEIKLSVDRKATKYVPLTPSVVGEVAHGYTISQISISPSTVEISGPEAVISAISEIPTTRIMVSNAENNFSVETTYQEQSKLVSVLDQGPFTATVSLSAQVMEREFTNIPVEVTGLDSSLELLSSLPAVNFILSGDVPLLENYNLPARAVYINLRDYTTPGSYEVPVRFNLSSNFTVLEKSVESISVQLESVKIEAEELLPSDSEEKVGQ